MPTKPHKNKVYSIRLDESTRKILDLLAVRLREIEGRGGFPVGKKIKTSHLITKAIEEYIAYWRKALYYVDSS